MKKFVLAVLVGLTVFATASIAAAEVTVGGEMEMRYDLWGNLDLNKQFNQDEVGSQVQNFFADRILLNVDAKITEGLEAFVELDSSGFSVFGTPISFPADERVAGVNRLNFTGIDSPVNYQGEKLAVRQAWINFMVPGIPVGMKVGHQPLALGHGISLDTHRMGTDAILLYSKPIEQLLIAGVYAKVVENSDNEPGLRDIGGLGGSIFATGNEHHDADVYAALANFTFMPGNTVGMNYLYVHDAATFGAGAVGHLHNIGITADGVIGPMNYKAEVDYQNINQDGHGGIPSTELQSGINNSWAAMLGVGAKLAMVNVGLEAAYGTGTTANKTSGSRTYLSPYGETSYNYAFLYNDKIGQGPLGTGGGHGLGDGTGGFGLANTGYLKLTAGLNPTDKLGVDMAVLYLRASASSFNGQSRDLGWEVDAHAGYKIYDNLNLDITGGVFVPGAWYAFNGDASPTEFGPSAVKDETDPNSSFKRNLAYGLETKLTVKF